MLEEETQEEFVRRRLKKLDDGDYAEEEFIKKKPEEKERATE